MKLSAVPRTMHAMGEPNPWQRAWDDWASVQIVHASTGTLGVAAMTRWLNGQPVGIILDPELNQRERRCHLAHELEHLDRGQPCRTLRAQIENRVVRATAAYLLPDIDTIGRTIGCYDLRRAAWELNVTFGVLIDRLNNLTDTESERVHSYREDIA